MKVFKPYIGFFLFEYVITSSNYQRSSRIMSQTLPHLIKVAVVNFPPSVHIMETANGIIPLGYTAEVLEALKMSTANLSFHLVRAPDDQFGSLINKTWTGMVKLLLENITDMAFAVTITKQRRESANFSPYVYTYAYKLVYRKLDQEWVPHFYWTPFDTTIWIGTLFITSVVLLFFSNCCSDSSLLFTLDCMEFCWPIVLQGRNNISSSSSKIVVGSYYLFSLILFCSYASLLTSQLSVTKDEIPFKSLEDLVDKKQYFPALMPGTKLYEDFQNAKIEPWTTGWELIKRNPKSIVKNFQNGIDLAYSTKAAFMTSLKDVALTINGNCSFTSAPNNVIATTASIAYSQRFLYSSLMNRRILQLREVGLLPVLTSRYFPNWIPCSNRGGFSPVSCKIIIGPLLLFMGGLILAVLCALVEIVFGR